MLALICLGAMVTNSILGTNKMLRLLDTFSGIGGFSFAAERLVGGFQTTQFVEWDPYCQRILKQHWPHVQIHGDIQTFFPSPLSADVICGGFPCQDISLAGRQAGITQGTRSGLFYELIRVIRLVRPKYIVLENVAAIVANGLDIVLSQLAEAGYDCEWACIRASDLGACHRRDRWWLVAYTNGTRPQRLRRKGELSEIGTKITTSWNSCHSMLNSTWRSYLSKPLLFRGDDGLSNRVDRIRALGNSVVPQVAAIPLQRIITLENETHL